MRNLQVKTVFTNYYLKLSLSVFLKCFSIFAQFQPHVSYRHVSYKNRVIGVRSYSTELSVLLSCMRHRKLLIKVNNVYDSCAITPN